MFKLLPFLFSLAFSGPFFDADPDPGGGGGDKEKKDPINPDPAKPKEEDKPKVPTVSLTQKELDDLIKERLDRAKSAWDNDIKTKKDEEQGEFKKIVEEEFKPLKDKVEKELTPEIEFYRTRTDAQISSLLKDLPAEVQALMPENMNRQNKLDWLEKAAKLKAADKKKDGNNPRDPDPEGTDKEQLLERTKRRMLQNPIYH